MDIEARAAPLGESQATGVRAALSFAAAGVAGLVGAWIGAGSVGLIGHPLRHGLTWAALGCAAVLAWPREGNLWLRAATVLSVAVLAIAMTASPLVPVNVAAVALVMLALACGQIGPGPTVLLLSAQAAAVLALFRFLQTAFPPVWLAVDALAGWLGHLAGLVTGRPLQVGATFAGVDLLAVMLYLAAAVGLRAARATPRDWRAWMPLGVSALAVLAGHFLYFVVLTFSADLQPPEAAPPPPMTPAGTSAQGASPASTWWVQGLFPWNVPVLGVMIHGLIAAGLLWWAWRGASVVALRKDGIPAAEEVGATAKRDLLGLALPAAIVLLAAALPVATSLFSRPPDLAGKRVVMYEKGFLNWLKPVHGQYGRLTIGMYGMLPAYLKSLGINPVVSADLSEKDLADADALILLYPNKPWEPGQLPRIWEFVRRGGTLLLFGEHTVREQPTPESEYNRFNEVLEPTHIRIPFDSAMFAVGGWLHSYQAVEHPTNAGITDNQNLFGVVIGASVEARWPASPLVIGRFGWNDPGDEANASHALMGNRRYDAGERLGDIVLAAEERLGNGKVIVFGDTSGMTNGLTVNCHPYTSRLIAYAVSGQPSPWTGWRQGAGLVLVLALIILLVWLARPAYLAGAVLGAAASLAVCTAVTHRAWQVIPDGRYEAPNNLAYIDASHLEAYSPESLRPEGLMGLELTLMRNGFLTLSLPELTPERLLDTGLPLMEPQTPGARPEGWQDPCRARLLISIAPAKPFTRKERETVKRFVWNGGIFIATVGYDESGPSRDLLADLDFYVGGRGRKWKGPDGRPEPYGHLKFPFFRGEDYYAHVRFHAGWPVECVHPNAMAITVNPGNPATPPVIALRRYGRGLVTVIGDTQFAMNKNLEHEDGSPFEGMRENADFWRWLIAFLRDGMGEGQKWFPPKPTVKRDEG